MKNRSSPARWLAIALLISPLALSWAPIDPSSVYALIGAREVSYSRAVFASFRELSITLGATLAVAMSLSVCLAYLSVLSMGFGRAVKSAFTMVESIPSILVALFFYAPVSGYLARHGSEASAIASLAVFIGAATVTALPEAVRGIAIPLTDLYYRKYSVSFRSYGFTKGRILAILTGSRAIRGSIARVAATVLMKTLVLDCSFGFVIQLGFGSYGTPAHLSPGALIAANRDALFEGGNPALFWLPSLALVAITGAFMIAILDGRAKEGR
ncbi:MAG TPA: hypothetical protein PLU93_03890 [Treponemataceae bacterium]|jgi:hypothetical protein|nr:hypothetical protein [Treponemataceae bacterium]